MAQRRKKEGWDDGLESRLWDDMDRGSHNSFESSVLDEYMPVQVFEQEKSGFWSGLYEGIKILGERLVDYWKIDPFASVYVALVTPLAITDFMVGSTLSGGILAGFVGLTLHSLHLKHKVYQEVHDHLRVNGWDDRFVTTMYQSKGERASGRRAIRLAAEKLGYLTEYQDLRKKK